MTWPVDPAAPQPWREPTAKEVVRFGVFNVVSGERDYQDSLWNPETTPSGGKHEVGAWVLFMEEYLAEARSKISRDADSAASIAALHDLRKVVAMGFACFEQHGVPARGMPGDI